jgi:hypothetical protein
MSRINNVQLGAALWGVLVGLGLAIAIAACASGSKSAQTPVAAGPDAAIARTDVDPRKQDITKLWNEIRDWRVEKGMTPDPLIDLTKRPEIIQSPVAKIRQCPTEEEPPKTDECTDVCTLKDDICDHAASICRIADQLGDDVWAREKCRSAKASCKEATDKCCGCRADEKPQATPPGGG